jgi:hypothetical protein
MPAYLKTLILVAESDRSRHVMQAFRAITIDEPLNAAWLGLMIFSASLALMALIAIFVHRQWRRRMASSPRGLFGELCRAHRLKWPQRRLLWRLAQSQKLADPAAMFLTPACFEIGRLTVEMRPHAEELRSLCARLFAEPRRAVKTEPVDAINCFREEDQPTAALPLSSIPPTLELPQWNVNTNTGAMD